MLGKILVTGGTGYIGSHTVVELLESGYEVVIVDNLSNSKEEVINRIEKITGKRPEFINADIRDEKKLNEIFSKYNFKAVIHLAGFKSVSESIKNPIEYYDNNINSTLTLTQQMIKHGVKQIIFSSTAGVYGSNPESLPITEDNTVGQNVAHPYARTKYINEQILNDLSIVNNDLKVVIFRYFNVFGAHDSGIIGENLNSIPDNIVPYILQVALGKLNEVNVFGDNYDTPDGTGIRDYIHVVDLARGHVAAIGKILPGVEIINLSTGVGTSVLELIKTFSIIIKRDIPYRIAPRRDGDIPISYASADKAKKILGWCAEKTIKQGLEDAWRWQSKNPNGY